MLEINKQLIDINYSKGRTITPEYIVIHETDNESYGANAMANRNYFANHSEAQASTHFVVDDSNIIQCASLDWRCWHVGDNNGYSDITNSNSIGIEICVNADGNYEQAKSNAIELVKYLMSKLGLGIDRVKMHNNASGKHCPRRILDNGLWDEFLERVNGSEVVTVTNTQYQAVVTNDQLYQSARQFVGDRCAELQTLLNSKGYDCGEIDGVMGQKTFTQLIQFQKDNNLVADGLAGDKTFAKLQEVIQATSSQSVSQSNNVLLIQQLCNSLGANISEDGIYGSQTESAIHNLPLCGVPYTQRECTRFVQTVLGIDVDGIFLYGTENSVKEWQSNHNLQNDGCVGFNTYKSLCLS